MGKLQSVIDKLDSAQAEVKKKVIQDSVNISAEAAAQITMSVKILEQIVPIDRRVVKSDSIAADLTPAEGEGKPAGAQMGEPESPVTEAPGFPASGEDEAIGVPETAPANEGETAGEVEVAPSDNALPEMGAPAASTTAETEKILPEPAAKSSQVGAMLERLDNFVPQLNTAGTQESARLARRTLQALALAGHNLQQAEAARQAVSSGGQLKQAVANLRDLAAEHADAPPDYVNALRRLEAIVHVVLDGTERAEVVELATQMRKEIDAKADDSAVEGALQAALEKLDELVARRLEADSKQPTDAKPIAVAKAPGGRQASSPAAGLPDEWGILTERLDQIAYQHYGSPAYWRLLAQVNNIDNPLRLAPNQPLVIPPDPRAQTR